MSPLHRARIAWTGGWEMWFVLAWATGYALLATLAAWLGSDGAHHMPIAERPFAFLLIMPVPLGLRLRSLLGAESLNLARSHATWVMRWFFLAVLPLAAVATAMPLAVTGIPPLWAIAIAAAVVSIGAWVGFSVFRSIPAFTAAIVLTSALRLVTVSDGWMADLSALALLAGVAAAARVAWRRLEARAILAWSWQRRSPRLERLSAWFDELTMDRPSPVAVRGHLPSLGTAMRLGLSGLGGSWIMRLIGFVSAGLLGWIISANVPEGPDRLAVLLSLSTMMACAFAPGWFSAGQGAATSSSGPARQMLRGLLVNERLRPLSRRQAAAATLLASIGNALSSILPMVGGLMLGFVLTDAWHARISGGLWLVIPQTVAVAACSSAAILLSLSIPKPVAITAAVALGIILLGAPILAMLADAAYPSGTAIAALLAALLVPLAWWRMSEAELP